MENRFVCTTKHCLPLLRTAKGEMRIIPRRRTKAALQTGIYFLEYLKSQYCAPSAIVCVRISSIPIISAITKSN